MGLNLDNIFPCHNPTDMAYIYIYIKKIPLKRHTEGKTQKKTAVKKFAHVE